MTGPLAFLKAGSKTRTGRRVLTGLLLAAGAAVIKTWFASSEQAIKLIGHLIALMFILAFFDRFLTKKLPPLIDTIVQWATVAVVLCILGCWTWNLVRGGKPPVPDVVDDSPREIPPPPIGTGPVPPSVIEGVEIVPSIRRQVIGRPSLKAAGCQTTSQALAVTVPNPGRLDQAFRGVVPGIELRETTRVGTTGYRDVRIDGGRLRFVLYAKGGGSRRKLPFVGQTCLDPEVASIGYEILAHYR